MDPTSLKSMPGVYIFDMDEVLVDISPDNYRSVRFNWRKYHKWLKDYGPLTAKQIINRPEFQIDEWMIRDEFRSLPEPELSKLRKTIKETLFADFFGKDIYAYLEPTAFARKTLMNKSFIDHNRVQKVYIVTRYTDKKLEEVKKKFIKKWFDHPKIEFVGVAYTEKKSEIFKKLEVNWNVLIDDEIKNIADFAENFDITGKEFIIPRTGYNTMPLGLDLLIKEKGATYSYFEKEDLGD
jgi:FMN phosphatase YigB (HAD superfamily)